MACDSLADEVRGPRLELVGEDEDVCGVLRRRTKRPRASPSASPARTANDRHRERGREQEIEIEGRNNR